MAISDLWYPARIAHTDEDSSENINTFIESRALAYPSQLEDDFAKRALNLGVESGMLLDVGSRVGLISLKILWQNENFYAIGLDSSAAMIERARETATAWELGERAFFQVGDARRMRFKNAYFDLVVSDSSLHRFDDVRSVLEEIRRVLKPTGALLIRDFRRPSRFSMTRHVEQQAAKCTAAMRPQLEAAIRSAYTEAELLRAVTRSGLERTQMVATDPDYVMIERRGQTDPQSWIIGREKYR